ncbi:MAG: hypothetical protein WCD44_02075 [Candidatus Babeliales bacterium]
MRKIFLYTLLFFFFSVINNKMVAGQEESLTRKEKVDTLRYYKKTWNAMGGEFFSVVKKLLNSELSIEVDLPDYREEFYKQFRSLPYDRQSSINAYEENFELNTQCDIRTLFHEPNMNKRLPTLKNMDELLDLIDDALEVLE